MTFSIDRSPRDERASTYECQAVHQSCLKLGIMYRTEKNAILKSSLSVKSVVYLIVLLIV